MAVWTVGMTGILDDFKIIRIVDFNKQATNTLLEFQ